MNRLVLIDGNAILHRAFHALPPLTSPDGKLVNAVYGFSTMLIRLIHDLQPTHIAVAFDRPAPTFRKKLYAEYQAKRPKMDDTLIPQVEGVHEVVRAFGIPIFEMDGYEADDVLGTVCRQISKKSQKSKIKKNENEKIDQIIIVTGDRDILQLVEDEKVLVYMPTKGLSEGKLFGEKEAEERLGVSPKLIPDYKALAGDASDNYPGIAGIGPKTAVEILRKAGSIDMLYKHIEKKTFGLSDTLVQKIQEGKEIALLSHKLATINQEVPIGIDIQTFSEKQLTSEQAIETLQTFGFRSLVKRLEKGENAKRDKETKIQRDKEKNDETGKQLSLV
jgi:DNA polymerase-1